MPTFPVFVTFIVEPSGSIYGVKSINNMSLPSIPPPKDTILKADGMRGNGSPHRSLQPLTAACEAALVAGAQKLPRLKSGTLGGRKVAVSFTIRLIAPPK